MATNLIDPQIQSDDPNPTLNAREEIKQRFGIIRDEVDRKETQLLAQVETEFSQQPIHNKQFDIVWHHTALSLALESICEIIEITRDCTNRLNKTQKLWESSPHGANRNNLSCPVSLSICSETNKIYVADKGNSRISCFNQDGKNIRVRDLTKDISSWTPVPELIICNPYYRLIWIYATSRPQMFNFIAINTSDFSEKYNIKGVPQVRALTINPETQNPKYFCYNIEDHSIVYGDVNPIIKDASLPKPTTIYLESDLLDESRMDIQMSVLDKFIFVLYRDTAYRILKFDFAGKLSARYLSCEKFGIIECFFLVSQNYFLLAKIGTTPITHITNQSIFSPVKKGQDCLQMCLVSSDGQVRGQLSCPIDPFCEDMDCSPIKCSQIIQHNNKIIALLRSCTTNLIAF